MRYQIDEAKAMVVTTITGKITPSEASAHARMLKADPVFDPSFGELVDLSEADVTELGYASLSQLKDEDPFSPASPRAIIAPSPVSYGISRMYEGIRGGNLAVFRTRQEAIKWLEDQAGNSSREAS